MCECSDLHEKEEVKEKTIEDVARDDAMYYVNWLNCFDLPVEQRYNLLIEKMRLDSELQKYNMLLDVSVEKAIDEITKSL